MKGRPVSSLAIWAEGRVSMPYCSGSRSGFTVPLLRSSSVDHISLTSSLPLHTFICHSRIGPAAILPHVLFWFASTAFSASRQLSIFSSACRKRRPGPNLSRLIFWVQDQLLRKISRQSAQNGVRMGLIAEFCCVCTSAVLSELLCNAESESVHFRDSRHLRVALL